MHFWKTAFVAFALIGSSWAGVLDLRCGTVETPEDFSFNSGGLDSFCGELTRKDRKFIVRFDIGAMAGEKMTLAKKPSCSFFRQYVIVDSPAVTGIIREGKRRYIMTTIKDVLRPGQPINFYAEIHNESDIAEYLLIVGSYKAKPTGH